MGSTLAALHTCFFVSFSFETSYFIPRPSLHCLHQNKDTVLAQLENRDTVLAQLGNINVMFGMQKPTPHTRYVCSMVVDTSGGMCAGTPNSSRGITSHSNMRLGYQGLSVVTLKVLGIPGRWYEEIILS